MGRVGSFYASSSGEMLWMERASCRGATNLFYSSDSDEIAMAKHMCSACWVIRECLAYALSTMQDQGIWGGCTEAELKKARRFGRMIDPDFDETQQQILRSYPSRLAHEFDPVTVAVVEEFSFKYESTEFSFQVAI